MNIKDLVQRDKGFTLVEILIVAALVGVVFAAAIAALMPMLNYMITEKKEVRTIDDIDAAFDWIKKDAIQADDADVTTEVNAVTIRITNYADPANPFMTYKYYVTGGTKLMRSVNGGPGELIIDTIDPGALPVYSLVAGVRNFLLINMHTRDASTNPETVIHKRCRAMLRCTAS